MPACYSRIDNAIMVVYSRQRELYITSSVVDIREIWVQYDKRSLILFYVFIFKY